MPAGRHADGGNLYLIVSDSGSRRWAFEFAGVFKDLDDEEGDAIASVGEATHAGTGCGSCKPEIVARRQAGHIEKDVEQDLALGTQAAAVLAGPLCVARPCVGLRSGAAHDRLISQSPALGAIVASVWARGRPLRRKNDDDR